MNDYLGFERGAMKKSAAGVLSFLVIGMLSAPHALAGTCALCRQTLASSGSDGLIHGFYWSIMLIAGMPVLMFASAGFFYWRTSRRLKRGQTLLETHDEFSSKGGFL